MAVRTAYRIRQSGTKRLSRKQIGALEVLAGAGITDHQISHDVFRFDKTLRNARLQSQRGRSDVAARSRNALGAGKRFTLTAVGAVSRDAGDEFRHAVGPMLVEVTAVERVPRALFLKTVVCAQIHHHGIRVKLGGQCSGSAMRQCQDDHVMAVEHFRRGVLDHEVRQLRNVRHMLAKLVPHRRMSGDAGHFEIRVCREYAQRLTTRVSSRAGHGYRVFGHVTSLFLDSLKHIQHTLYALHCIIMQFNRVG